MFHLPASLNKQLSGALHLNWEDSQILLGYLYSSFMIPNILSPFILNQIPSQGMLSPKSTYVMMILL